MMNLCSGRRTAVVRLVPAVLAALWVLALSGPAASARPLQVDDLFRLEGIPPLIPYHEFYAFSPDGQAFAFVRQRPQGSKQKFHWGILNGGDNSDIWVQTSAGATPINITQGATDDSGWFMPKWSPDGQCLALIGTRGGNTFLWVWDKTSHRLRQLTTRGVDYDATTFWWLDNQQLLCAVLAEGERYINLRNDIAEIAPLEWRKAAEGRESTASVINSGRAADMSQRPVRQIMVVDVLSAQTRVVVNAVTRGIYLSPSRKAVAFNRQLTESVPSMEHSLNFVVGDARLDLSVVDLSGTSLLPPQQSVSEVLLGSVRWSARGDEVICLAFDHGRANSASLKRIRIGPSSIASMNLEGLNVLPFNETQVAELGFTADDELLVKASKQLKGERARVTDRRDWWRVSNNGARLNLTAHMTEVPTLVGTAMWRGRENIVGIAAGKVWRIEVNSGIAVDLTATFPAQVLSAAWPTSPELHHGWPALSKIVLAVQGSPAFYELDLKSGVFVPFINSESDAALMGYSPQSSDSVFSAVDRNGARLWRQSHTGARTDSLVNTNTFLKEIDEAECQIIDYVSLDGSSLKAGILLPPGYQSGKRYPLLTWVYPGIIFDPKHVSRSGEYHPLNMQLAAAHGYAVLLPSMPSGPQGAVGDPLLELQNGVMPAVDQAIALGIADPQRLFLAGHSFGGFATYGLLGQTTRFKAAVALAGAANLISQYGQFFPYDRYTAQPLDFLFAPTWSETGQGSLGNPPWKDLGRYLRNSPISYVDRVQTPLLIIQGDMDYVPLQQGEEFFTALYRQGKRAQFVRYWGEAHLPVSPANIRDMWERIFAWLDEHGEVLRAESGN